MMGCQRGILLFLLSFLAVAVGHEFQLFVSDKQSKIYVLNETGDVIDTISTGGPVAGVAVDPYAKSLTIPGANIVYSTDKTVNNTAIYRKLAQSDPDVILDFSVYQVYADRLVLDPTSRNIYFTGVFPNAVDKYSFIAVLSPNGKHIAIVTDLDAPKDIVLHPEKRMLFWSDIGKSPHIASADMNGANPSVIISFDIVWPNGLAIDFKNNMLYWTDGARHAVERCNFTGGLREVVLRVTVYLMDILIDGDFFYFNNLYNAEITRVRISNTAERTKFRIPGARKLRQMAVLSSACLQTRIICRAGTYVDVTDGVRACRQCPKASYQFAQNQDTCLACDHDYTTLHTGSVSQEQCIVECDKGQGVSNGDTTSCRPCAVGQYNNKTGENPNICKLCPRGLTTTNPGQSICNVSTDEQNYGPSIITIEFFLKYEVSDCSASSLSYFQLTLEETIRTGLVRLSKRYKGLCGINNNSCNSVTVRIDQCSSSNRRKRETTSTIQATVTVPNTQSTVNDIADSSLNDIADGDINLSTVDLLGGLLGTNDLLPPTGDIGSPDLISPPLITHMSCPELPDLTNGQLSNDAVSLGTETNVTCNVNFTLFGAANLRCTDDATWSSPFPDCKKDCPQITSPHNGKMITHISKLSLGTTVSFICHDDYILIGASTLTCLTNATWDNPLPECKQDCDEHKYGPDCSKTCTCNKTNTYDCDDENGNCFCRSGWAGENCTDDVNECHDNPCVSPRVKCVNTQGSYTCQCPAGWTGTDCRTDIDECQTDPCTTNNTKCVNTQGYYSCQCKDGWTGIDCRTDIDECQTDPCRTINTKCVNTQGSYSCQCKGGWTSTDCRTDIDECQTDPCRTINTKCVNTQGSYSCQCKGGWTGTDCRTDIDECQTDPCKTNNRKCVNTQGSYKCHCKDGWTGNKCTEAVDDSVNTKCVNTVAPGLIYILFITLRLITDGLR